MRPTFRPKVGNMEKIGGNHRKTDKKFYVLRKKNLAFGDGIHYNKSK